MAAKRSPGYELFHNGLEAIREDIPSTYSNLVLLKIRSPKMLRRVTDPKVLAKLANDKTAGVYFNQVVKGQTVDLIVLEILTEIVTEIRSTRQPVAA